MQDQNDWSQLIIQCSFVILLLAYALYKIVQRRSAKKFEDGPLLSSSNMLDSNGLLSMEQGELSGFKYNLMTNNSGRVMVLAELGRDTGAHILAFGDKSRLGEAVREGLSKKWLVPVALEGDFPDYFRLYCSPEKQIELREFFNPKTMLQFVDFCREYDFETFDDTLFISQAENAENKSDQTTLIANVQTFLQENAEILTRL